MCFILRTDTCIYYKVKSYDFKKGYIFVFEVVYTGNGLDILIRRGPASCRRRSKQGAKKQIGCLFCSVCLHFTNAQMTSTLFSPMLDYYNDEEDLDSVDDDDDRSFRGRGSEEGNVMNALNRGVWLGPLARKGKKTCVCVCTK